MKVVHLNTNDGMGGAARAAYRLHCGLRGLGCDSEMLVLHRHRADASVKRLTPPRSLAGRLLPLARAFRIRTSFARYWASRPGGYELFSDDRAPYRAELAARLSSDAVAHLHWIAGFVDYRSFFSIVPPRSPSPRKMRAPPQSPSGGLTFVARGFSPVRGVGG